MEHAELARKLTRVDFCTKEKGVGATRYASGGGLPMWSKVRKSREEIAAP